MVWLAPMIVLGLGTFILVNYLKLHTKPQKIIPFTKEKVPYDDLIEKELKEMG
jgi:cytochrome c-type biogenesis protein CcmH/NrfF